MRKLMKGLDRLAQWHGGTLRCFASLRPMTIEYNAKNDFSRGVLATIAEVVVLASQIPEGRQALRDLGFQPVPEGFEWTEEET